MNAATAAHAAIDAKVLSTLQACCALAGFELIQLPAGDYLVVRWGMTRALANEQAVRDFLAQVGAAA